MNGQIIAIEDCETKFLFRNRVECYKIVNLFTQYNIVFGILKSETAWQPQLSHHPTVNLIHFIIAALHTQMYLGQTSSREKFSKYVTYVVVGVIEKVVELLCLFNEINCFSIFVSDLSTLLNHF